MKIALYVGGPADGRMEAVQDWLPRRVPILHPVSQLIPSTDLDSMQDLSTDYVEYERHLGLPLAYDHNRNAVAIYTTRDMETEEVLAALMSNYRPLFTRR